MNTNSYRKDLKDFLKNNIIGILIVGILTGILGNYAYDELTKKNEATFNPQVEDKRTDIKIKKQSKKSDDSTNILEKKEIPKKNIDISESKSKETEIPVSRLTWDIFGDVNFEIKYNDVHKIDFYHPIFGEIVKSFDGKRIQITGYLGTVESKDKKSSNQDDIKNYFFLSSQPLKKVLKYEVNDVTKNIFQITTNFGLLKISKKISSIH